MIVLRLSSNAVPGIISLISETPFITAIVLTSHLSSLYSATDFALCVHCRFSPQSCWHTIRCSGIKDNLCNPASLSWGTYRTAVPVCPLPIVGSFAFGRNTTPLSFILYATLFNTTNFLLSIETTQSHIPHLHL